MKRQTWLKCLVTPLSFSLLSFPVLAAEEETSKIADKVTLPISFENGLTYLDSFTSKVWFGNDTLGLTSEMLYFINSLVQAVFWLTKQLFYVFSQIYWKLNDTSVFDEYLETALYLSAKLYNDLYKSSIPLLGLCLSSYLVYLFIFKNAQFFKALVQVFTAFVCAGILFTSYNGKLAIRHFRDGVQTITNEVVSQSIANVSFKGRASGNPFALQTAPTEGLQGKETMAVLDKYFDIAVWQPYRFLNADVTYDEKTKTPSFNLTDQQLVQLLDYQSGNDEFDMNGEKIKDIAGGRDKPKVKMLKGAWGKKFSYALASVVDVIVLGVILDFFAIGSFVLSMSLILLIIFAGLVAFISIFPTMENALFNLVKRMAGVIILASLTTFGSLLFIWLYDMLSGILATIFGGNPILTALGKLVVLYTIWKKRDLFIGLLTANRMTSLNNNFTRKMSHMGRKVQGKGLKVAQKNAMISLAMARGGYRLGTRQAIEGVRRSTNNFLVRPNRKPSEVERYQGYTSDMIAQDSQNDKQRRQVETFRNIGRNLSATKDSMVGNMKLLQAEGMTDKDSKAYKDLRQEAEERLSRSAKHRQEVLPYHQRLANDKAKERLKYQRMDRRQLQQVAPPSAQERQKQMNYFLEKRMRKKPYSDLGNNSIQSQSYPDIGFDAYKQKEQALRQSIREKQRQQALDKQEVKERLLENRRQRVSSGQLRSGYRQYRIEENKVQAQVKRSNHLQPSSSGTSQQLFTARRQKLDDQEIKVTKDRLLANRQERLKDSNKGGYKHYRETELQVKSRLRR